MPANCDRLRCAALLRDPERDEKNPIGRSNGGRHSTASAFCRLHGQRPLPAIAISPPSIQAELLTDLLCMLAQRRRRPF